MATLLLQASSVSPASLAFDAVCAPFPLRALPDLGVLPGAFWPDFQRKTNPSTRNQVAVSQHSFSLSPGRLSRQNS
ncbi:hypothetical protein [Hymenobacter sp. GOD-10R]|uniref:hypothetical protein n=1 Tax=Hymenobacter sp. GOD-10R TaxID=3093922 RepID=UPI002D78EBE9|nr:hypothetical protein [Hymenobacter sp. GOD-10R]WRQ28509.1 hypothetical protein SD425_25925 [Hymenobacter sp. GOD-10R]